MVSSKPRVGLRHCPEHRRKQRILLALRLGAKVSGPYSVLVANCHLVGRKTHREEQILARTVWRVSAIPDTTDPILPVPSYHYCPGTCVFRIFFLNALFPPNAMIHWKRRQSCPTWAVHDASSHSTINRSLYRLCLRIRRS